MRNKISARHESFHCALKLYGALAQNSQISQDENLFREFSNAMRAVTLLGLLLALLCLQGMEAQVKTSKMET